MPVLALLDLRSVSHGHLPLPVLSSSLPPLPTLAVPCSGD